MNEFPTGSHNYKAFVGAYDFYDVVGADQFVLLTTKGLRDNHSLLDFGCGSLRLGRMAIPYLNSNNYYGIEPEKWLVEEGVNNNLGNDILNVKNPLFNYNADFNLDVFEKKFDFIIACSIFSHATKAQIEKALHSAKKVMHNKSIFFASFMVGDSDYEGQDWVYPKVISYTMNWMTKTAEKAKLRCQKIEWTSPHLQTWVAFTLNDFDKKEIEELKTANAFIKYSLIRKSQYGKQIVKS